MHQDIYEAVAELGNFFRELCYKTLNVGVVERLKAEILVILCKLEKKIPPSFFDVMVYLAVHLPEEALLRGPIQYGWMFPVERRLLTCKRYVQNTARPEGLIAEACVVDECLTFCSRYFDDVEMRFNWPGRNRERDDSHVGDVSVFNHGVHFLGGSEYIEAGADYDKMVWLVLSLLAFIACCPCLLSLLAAVVLIGTLKLISPGVLGFSPGNFNSNLELLFLLAVLACCSSINRNCEVHVSLLG
jgi:hypothetical protein